MNKRLKLMKIILLIFFVYSFIGKSVSLAGCSAGEIEELQTKNNFYNSQIALADEMTAQMINTFNKSEANVVLLGNVGRDVSDSSFDTPYNLNENIDIKHKYMHTGLAYKDPESGTWKVIHLLNDYKCGKISNTSSISNDNLRSFFTHPHHKMDISIAYPSTELQNKILEVIQNDAKSLHQSEYNMIANPGSMLKQNSNQFILNIIATAQKESELCQAAIATAVDNGEFKKLDIMNKNRLEAKLCAFANGFKPSYVNAKIYQTIGATIAPFLHPEISLGDHSIHDRIKSSYPFVSAESVFDYLKISDPYSSERSELCPKIGCDKEKIEIYSRFYIENPPNDSSK